MQTRFQRAIPRRILQALFPPRCLLCGKNGHEGMDICAGCYADLPLNRPACRQCGENLGAAAQTVCGACLVHAPAFDVTHAPFLYRGPLPFQIGQLKFHGRLPHARLLGQLLARHLISVQAEMPECLLPTPLHPRRYRARGFNQAHEIGREVAAELNLPLNPRLVTRQQDTPHQTGLSAEERRRNLRQAFQLRSPLAYRKIAILDDVMTTGATVNALAQLLKRHGATQVQVWTCARAE